MAQAQAVANLVHGHVFQGVGNVGVGLRALRVEQAAFHQQVKAKSRIFKGVLAIAARVPGHGPRLREGRRGGRLLLVGPSRHAFSRTGAEYTDPVLVDDGRRTQDFAGARVGLAGPDGGRPRPFLCKPAHRQQSRAFGGGPVGVGRLLLHTDGVAKPGALERRVPFQGRCAQGFAPALGDVAVQHHADGLLGLRDLGSGVLFFQAPAADQVRAAALLGVVAEVHIRLHKVTHPRVGGPRGHGRRRQGFQGDVQAEEQAACIGHRWRRGCRCCRGTRGSHGRRGQARHRIVLAHGQVQSIWQGANAFDAGVGAVQAVGRAVSGLERGLVAHDVTPQQQTGVDQQRLAGGVRGGCQWGRGQQAVGVAFADRLGQWRAGRRAGVFVAGHQLHGVAHAAQQHDVRARHQAREEGALAQAARQRRGQEQRCVQHRCGNLQPDPVVAGPD